jgi:hypothetical protein
MKANKAALDGYRLGWASGDTDIILGVCTDTFNFTWVPEDDVVSRRRFPVFFANFMAESEKDGRAKYFMQFDNIIHRQVRTQFQVTHCFRELHKERNLNLTIRCLSKCVT